MAVDDIEDRIGAPLRLVGRSAPGRGPTTPFIGEDNLGTVVTDRRRVPVREVRIGYLVNPDRVSGIGDVDQNAVALACGRSYADRRVRGDVVARVGDRRRPPRRARRMPRRWQRVLQP